MNRENLFEAIGEIDGRSVRRAEKYRASGKPGWVRWAALAACVALLVGAFAVVPRLKKDVGETEINGDASGLAVVRAQYPAPVAKKMSPGSSSQIPKMTDLRNFWVKYCKGLKIAK